MSQQDLLRRVAEALDAAKIEYMITGSIASSLQGEPRLTHDLDVLITIESHQLPALVAAFPPSEFYLDEEAAREAIRTAGMFNVIDASEGDKIDFWLLRDDPFDQSRFARRYDEELFGTRIKVSRPEDTILAKLWWANLAGGSEKHFQDALRVYEVQLGVLDLGYLNEWASRLRVQQLWSRLQTEASPPT